MKLFTAVPLQTLWPQVIALRSALIVSAIGLLCVRIYSRRVYTGDLFSIMQTAEALVFFAKIYVGLGGLVAVAFLAAGIERVDPSSRGVYAFRPLLLPGLALLWPYVLFRWLGRVQSAKASED